MFTVKCHTCRKEFDYHTHVDPESGLASNDHLHTIVGRGHYRFCSKRCMDKYEEKHPEE